MNGRSGSGITQRSNRRETEMASTEWHVDLQIVMVTVPLKGLGRENKGHPEASNKFLDSDLKIQAIKIG